MTKENLKNQAFVILRVLGGSILLRSVVELVGVCFVACRTVHAKLPSENLGY
jgi:hypothetical protein